MNNSLEQINSNSKYWGKGYHSPNVESYVFRFYGQILKYDFKMPYHNKKTNLLDFGCGQGAAVNFFNQIGFNAYGFDANSNDLNVAKKLFPKSASNYYDVPSDTLKISSLLDVLDTTEKFDVIISCQVLYYLPKFQFQHFVKLAFDSLKKGGVFFASMMSEKWELFFNNSFPTGDKDGWMREVKFSNSRHDVSNYFMHFVSNEEDLCSKFNLFKPLHIGEYATRLRNDDGSGHHYTFCGIKD